METKAENPVSLLAGQEVLPVARAYFELCHLKQLFRQGWLRRGIPRHRCESVAEHSFGVAMLAMWLAHTLDPELDLLKVVRMALVHDFGEVYAGDLIPGDAVSAEEKRLCEAASVQEVFAKLSGGEAYQQLWHEFEAGLSPEARFLRQIDRLEMGLQACVYQRQGFDNMSEFQHSAQQALADPWLQQLLKSLSG